MLSLALVVAAIALLDSNGSVPDPHRPLPFWRSAPATAHRRVRDRSLRCHIFRQRAELHWLSPTKLGALPLTFSAREVKYWLIVVGGVSLSLGGVAIWIERNVVGESSTAQDEEQCQRGPIGGIRAGFGSRYRRGRCSPAFPFFAAISVVVGSVVASPEKVLLLGVETWSMCCRCSL